MRGDGRFSQTWSHIYPRTSCVNHAREHVALTREHPLTARRNGVGVREYLLTSVKFKSSGTVSLFTILK